MQESLELQQTAEQNQLRLEKALSAANALVEHGQQRQTVCEQQIEAIRSHVHQAELRAAVSETRCQELLKQNEKLEQENQGLKKK